MNRGSHRPNPERYHHVKRTTASLDADEFRTLSERLSNSDPDALELLFRKLRGRLVAFVGGMLRDQEAAHDVVQDVFVELWEARTRIDKTLSIKAFMYRMARNRAYNLTRDRRSHAAKHAEIHASSNGFSSADGPDASTDARLIGDALHRWLDELPERQRDALRLSRFEGLSHEEIAKVMEISPRTVNNHIVRALATLDERLRRFQAVNQP
jgi:RNA polymerase sigma-70 factor, ECF subfamily